MADKKKSKKGKKGKGKKKDEVQAVPECFGAMYEDDAEECRSDSGDCVKADECQIECGGEQPSKKKGKKASSKKTSKKKSKKKQPEYDYEELEGMSIKKLKKIADEVEVEYESDDDKEDILEAICEELGLEAPEEEEEEKPKKKAKKKSKKKVVEEEEDDEDEDDDDDDDDDDEDEEEEEKPRKKAKKKAVKEGPSKEELRAELAEGLPYSKKKLEGDFKRREIIMIAGILEIKKIFSLGKTENIIEAILEAQPGGSSAKKKKKKKKKK